MKRIFSTLKTMILRWVVRVATYLGVPSDKLLHFICSALIMAMCSIFLNPMLSSFITIAIGLLKELYDKLSGRGCAELVDLWADIIGIAIGWLIVAIV